MRSTFNVFFFVGILLFYRSINIYILLCVMEEDFETIFHHRGKFINDGRLKYERETSTISFDLGI